MINDIIKLLNINEINNKIKDYTIINKTDETIYELIFEEQKRECPNCGCCTGIVLHGYKTIDITHSVCTFKKAKVRLKRRRYLCKNCKSTFFEKNPFSREFDRISFLTKRIVLEKLKDHTRTFTSVAKDLFISDSTVIDIFDKAVNVKRGKFGTVVCIDEFYKGKSRKPRKLKYACTFLDFETKHILDIIPSRRQDFLYDYPRRPKYQLASVRW